MEESPCRIGAPPRPEVGRLGDPGIPYCQRAVAARFVAMSRLVMTSYASLVYVDRSGLAGYGPSTISDLGSAAHRSYDSGMLGRILVVLVPLETTTNSGQEKNPSVLKFPYVLGSDKVPAWKG
jgi:hypothetical protein